MMGKITKGGSFGGCVDYVTRRKKDNPDGTPCNEWRIIDLKDGKLALSAGTERLRPLFLHQKILSDSCKEALCVISVQITDYTVVIHDAQLLIREQYGEKIIKFFLTRVIRILFPSL